MLKLFSYLRGLAIIHYACLAIKQLWPFLLAFIFWPEIDAMCSAHIPMWTEYVGTVSDYIVTAARTVRGLPFIGELWKFLADALRLVKDRLFNLLFA